MLGTRYLFALRRVATFIISSRSQEDKYLLPEDAPESCAKMVRLDEGTYIDDKIAIRRALNARSGNLEVLEATANGEQAHRSLVL